MTGRAAFRTALPRVSSWCDAKGRDSLLEFHAHRCGACMHGAARARHSRVSLQNGILRTIQDLLRSAQGFEMRVLPPNHSFSKAENRVTSTPANMHPSDRTPKISKQHAPSHYRSPTLSQTVRRHGHGPIIVSRQPNFGVINFALQHACKHRCDRIPKVRKSPAPSRHRPPALSQTVRGHGHTPAAATRWSKNRPRRPAPRQHVCKHRCDRIAKVRKSPAPSRHRSPALSQTVRGRGHTPAADSRWSKKPATPTRPRQHVCKHRV